MYIILPMILSLILFPVYSKPQKKQIKIAVLDSGYVGTARLCKTGHKDFTTTGLKDKYGHGTHITNTIVSNLDKGVDYCIIVIKWFDPETPKYFIFNNSYRVFEYVNTLDVDIVNYSAGGEGFSEQEKRSVSRLIKKGVKVFVAAGNDGKNLDEDCFYYPACYNIKGLNVIGNVDAKGKRYKSSNYGKVVTQWENGVEIEQETVYNRRIKMTGSSVSTAVASAKEANRRFK